MLRRIYVDNFRSFSNFELKLDRRSLWMGSNGSGKSSLMDLLARVRRFVLDGKWADDCFPLREHTRWMTNPRQTIELEFVLDDTSYLYRLVTEPVGAEQRPRVAEEIVKCGEREIFAFRLGEIQLYNDKFEPKVKFHTNWHRSGLGIVEPRPDNQVLTRLKRFLSSIWCFQPNPFAMLGDATKEKDEPSQDLSDFVAWYRHLRQSNPDRDEHYLDALREVVDGFQFFRITPSGEARILEAEFSSKEGLSAKFGLRELSDGQRCLFALYAIAYFLLKDPGVVIIDEPDNFVALREIQPWLLAVDDILEASPSQLVLISHHPEILNQWAPEHGVVFFREPNGPTRTKRFHRESHEPLTPSESWREAGNMNKPSEVIVLAEDRRQQNFARGYLKSWGYEKRKVRFLALPAGRGAGEQYVRGRFPDELRACARN
ncbi:MAG: AAA family ATPase [Bryobacteraceae bacterium]